MMSSNAPELPPIATQPLGISEQTAQVVVIMFAGTICLVLLAIVGVLCVRVAIDGNSTLTSDITHSLAAIVPWLAGALVAAMVGTRTIAALVLRKLT